MALRIGRNREFGKDWRRSPSLAVIGGCPRGDAHKGGLSGRLAAGPQAVRQSHYYLGVRDAYALYCSHF